MRYGKSIPLVLLSSLAICSLSAHASSFVAYGTLSNFDAFCDVADVDNYGNTITACEGFEIELEDLHSNEVAYIYSYNRYGHPTVTEDSFVDANGVSHARVRVRYAATWDGSTWQIDPLWAKSHANGTNNVNVNSVTTTGGHTCVLGVSPVAGATYETSGCEHFGLSLTGNPTKVTYNWLVPELDRYSNSPTGNLQHSVSSVAVPPATYYVQPAPVGAVNQQPVVQAVIEAPEPPPFQEFGDAQWVKVFKRQTSQQLQLDKMMSDDPSIPNGSDPTEIEIDWQLIQQVNPNPNWCLDANPPMALPCPDKPAANGVVEGNDQLAAGNNSIVRRYEFYAYAGPYDAETHEATPYGNVSPPGGQDPDPRDLGEYQGAQMEGVNILIPMAVNDQTPTGEIGVAYKPTVIVTGGVQPYTIDISAGILPTGMSVSDTGVLMGIPSDIGSGNVTVDVTDFNGDWIDVSLNLVIANAIKVSTSSLPSGTVGVAYSANLSSTGGVAPTTWKKSGTLPSGLSLSSSGVLSGTPSAAGTFNFSAIVTDSLGGTASKSFSVTIAAGTSSGGTTTCPAWTGTKLEAKSTVSAVGPGYVVVNGKTINYNSCTTLKLNDVSSIEVGMPVQYKAYKNSNGVITASYLEIN